MLITESENHVVVYGGSGHGKVVADILVSAGFRVLGFVDDAIPRGEVILDLPVLGDGRWLESHSGVYVALGIGENRTREKIMQRCLRAGSRIATAIHSGAIVARSATVGVGAVVMAGAILNPSCVVGVGAIVNTGAVVEHDVSIGEYAHLSPNATTGGGCSVGKYAHIGLGANILPMTKIGSSCVVGAGAVVTRDLPVGVIAMGVPARVVNTS